MHVLENYAEMYTNMFTCKVQKRKTHMHGNENSRVKSGPLNLTLHINILNEAILCEV